MANRELTPFVVERFGGLNLAVDPQEGGALIAQDMLNVDVDRQGRLRTRDGFAQHNSNDLGGQDYVDIFGSRLNDGEILLVHGFASSAANVDVMTASGAITNIGSLSGSTQPRVSGVAAIGLSTGPRVYIANSHGASVFPAPGNTLQKYSGSALANSVGKPAFVTVTPRSNRLAQGHYAAAADSPSGANGSASTVFISDDNDPDTYNATNFVRVGEGDGEYITGMVTFGANWYVFKQTRLFRFFGETPDDDGLPIFNNDPVDLPASIEYSPLTLGRQVVVGNKGIYFVARDGLYRTNGFKVDRISDPVQRIFTTYADPSVLSTLRMFRNNIPPRLSWANGRLFLHYRNGLDDARVLVWDEATEQFLLWIVADNDVGFATIPQATAAPSHSTTTEGPALFFTSGTDVYQLTSSELSDDGTAIDWTYTSGYYDLGSPGEKLVRYTDLYGAGNVTAQMLALGGRSGTPVTDAGSDLALGTIGTLAPPPIARGRRKATQRGRLFAHKLSGSGPMVVSRIEHRFTPGRMT